MLPKSVGTEATTQAASSVFTPTGGYATHHYVYANGQQVGEADGGGGIDVLSGVTGFSNSATGTQGYVVQAGDTLTGIAQQVYGDASLWYVVADANGLQSDDDLVTGQTLKLPQVQTNSNTSETFKPYDPNAIQGGTTPTLAHVQAPQPPPSGHHCNALADIVIIAVAVVVSVVTVGALAPEMGYLAAGAIAGAAASTASQLTGDALGVSHGFDWGQVLVGAAAGAIGGGLSAAFSEGGTFASTFASTTGDGITPLGNAIIGAASYAGTYEADKLVGEPAHFSWAGLVASAAGSAAGGEFGPTNAQAKAGLTGETLEGRIESNLVDNVVTRETSVALGDDHVQSWKQVGEDVFGNALGNAIGQPIARNIQQAEAEKRARQVNAISQQAEKNFSNQLQGGIDAQMAKTGAQAMANIRAQGQATLDQEYAGTEQSLDDEMMTSSEASTEALLASQSVEPDITDSMSPLQMAVMDANPASPVYAQLVDRLYQQQLGTDFNTNSDAIEQLLPPENFGGGTGAIPVTRPPVTAPYWFGSGYFDQEYATAAGIFTDTNNTPLQRAGGFLLAMGVGAPKVADDVGRSILNAFADASVVGGYVYDVVHDQDSFQRLADIGNASGAFGQGVLGIAGVAGVVDSTVVGSLLDTGAVDLTGGTVAKNVLKAPVVIGTASGAVAGYQTGGARGAVAGGIVGGLVGWANPEGSIEAGDSVSSMFATTGKTITFNAAGGFAATVSANLATGNPWNKDWGYGIALGGLTPIASGEAFFVGAGGVEEFGPTAAKMFNSATGTFNVFGSALIAAKDRNER